MLFRKFLDAEKQSPCLNKTIRQTAEMSEIQESRAANVLYACVGQHIFINCARLEHL